MASAWHEPPVEETQRLAVSLNWELTPPARPSASLPRRDRRAQRGDPVLEVGVVVEVRPAGRPAVAPGDAGDQVHRDADLLVLGHVAPVQHQLAAAYLEEVHQRPAAVLG